MDTASAGSNKAATRGARRGGYGARGDARGGLKGKLSSSALARSYQGGQTGQATTTALKNGRAEPLSRSSSASGSSASGFETYQPRFEDPKSKDHFVAVKKAREHERAQAIAQGHIPDPSKSMRLDDAITFSGTCQTMCPEYERLEREVQNNIERWERLAGTSRADPAKTVKAFHRPAAGHEQPLPSDVRPPIVLQKTLVYLIYDLLAQDPDMEETHPFIRDRTRSIRQDLTLQNLRGLEAVDLHEKIARYHIVCLYALCEKKDWSEQQEMEQLRKVLQSLVEFYDDLRAQGKNCANEAEFRAYYILAHSRDTDILRQIELLPSLIFDDSRIQMALEFHDLMQCSTRPAQHGQLANTESCQLFFSKFFRKVASSSTPYLFACLLHTQFSGIREDALRALRKAFVSQHRALPMEVLARMLGYADVVEASTLCAAYGIEVEHTADLAGHSMPVSALLNRQAPFTVPSKKVKTTKSARLVESKRNGRSIQEIIFATALAPASTRLAANKRLESRPLDARPPPASPSAARTISDPPVQRLAPAKPSTLAATSSSSTAQTPLRASVPSFSFQPPKSAPSSTPQVSAPRPEAVPHSQGLSFQRNESDHTRKRTSPPRAPHIPKAEPASRKLTVAETQVNEALKAVAQDIAKNALREAFASISRAAYQTADQEYEQAVRRRSVLEAKARSAEEAARLRQKEADAAAGLVRARTVYDTQVTRRCLLGWRRKRQSRETNRRAAYDQLDYYRDDLDAVVTSTSAFSLNEVPMQLDLEATQEPTVPGLVLEKELSRAIEHHDLLWKAGTFAEIIIRSLAQTLKSNKWLTRTKIVLESYDPSSRGTQWLATKLGLLENMTSTHQLGTPKHAKLVLTYSQCSSNYAWTVPLLIYDNGDQSLTSEMLKAKLRALVTSEVVQGPKPAVLVVHWTDSSTTSHDSIQHDPRLHAHFAAIELYRPSELAPEEGFERAVRKVWSSIVFPKTIGIDDFDLVGAEVLNELRDGVISGQDLILSSALPSETALTIMLTAIRDLLLAFVHALGLVLHPEAEAELSWLREITIAHYADDMSTVVQAFLDQFHELGSLSVDGLKAAVRRQAGLDPTSLAFELAAQLRTIMWQKHDQVSRDEERWLPFRAEELYKPKAIMQTSRAQITRNMERALSEVLSLSRPDPVGGVSHAAGIERNASADRSDSLLADSPASHSLDEKRAQPNEGKRATMADLRDLMNDVRQTLEL